MSKNGFTISARTVFFVLLVLTFSSIKNTKGESLTITTYYPSPFGVYNRLKTNELIIQPREYPPENPVEGMLFFSTGEDKNSKVSKMPKGIWIYANHHWYPLVLLEENKNPKE